MNTINTALLKQFQNEVKAAYSKFGPQLTQFVQTKITDADYCDMMQPNAIKQAQANDLDNIIIGTKSKFHLVKHHAATILPDINMLQNIDERLAIARSFARSLGAVIDKKIFDIQNSGNNAHVNNRALDASIMHGLSKLAEKNFQHKDTYLLVSGKRWSKFLSDTAFKASVERISENGTITRNVMGMTVILTNACDNNTDIAMMFNRNAIGCALSEIDTQISYAHEKDGYMLNATIKFDVQCLGDASTLIIKI